MIELIDGNIKIVIFNYILYVFEKLEERLNMLSKDKKGILKDLRLGFYS